MLRAVAALRLRVQGTQGPHDHGMPEEPSALFTQFGAINHFNREFLVLENERFPESMPVVGITVHGKEPDQLVGI